MALKYRVVYDDYTRYKKNTNSQKLLPYLASLALLSVFVLCIIFSPEPREIYSLFLPGNPSVTGSAFSELIEAIQEGKNISAALDIFCETVMNVK